MYAIVELVTAISAVILNEILQIKTKTEVNVQKDQGGNQFYPLKVLRNLEELVKSFSYVNSLRRGLNVRVGGNLG